MDTHTNNLKDFRFFRVFLFSFCLLKFTSNVFSFQNGYASNYNILITTITGVSWGNCVTSCMARSNCRSVELVWRFHLCQLFANDTTQNGVKLKHTPGSLYSEKKSWTKKTIDYRCTNNCNKAETCFINSTVGCRIKECDQPPILDSGSVILGTQLSVGSKILYVCTDNKSVTSPSICGTDGLWTLQEFSCPKECGGREFQGKCYLFISEMFNFVQAEENCQRLGARLVHIATNDENEFLKDQRTSLFWLFNQYASSWIGLTGEHHEGQWTWYNTNESTTFTDWYDGMGTNDSTDNCAALFTAYSGTSGWYAYPCDSLRRSICEVVDFV